MLGWTGDRDAQGRDLEEMLESADSAIASGKRSGRACIVIAS